MSDPYTELRYLTHARVGLIWEMAESEIDLEGEEATMAEILRQHPEYLDIWEKADTMPPDEEVLRDGVNPFVHIAIHQTVENQITDRTPPQTAETLEALIHASYTRHEAIHAIGALIAEQIFGMMQDSRPFDETSYVEALRDLAQTSKPPRKRQRPRQRQPRRPRRRKRR